MEVRASGDKATADLDISSGSGGPTRIGLTLRAARTASGGISAACQ